MLPLGDMHDLVKVKVELLFHCRLDEVGVHVGDAVGIHFQERAEAQLV